MTCRFVKGRERRSGSVVASLRRSEIFLIAGATVGHEKTRRWQASSPPKDLGETNLEYHQASNKGSEVDDTVVDCRLLP